MFVYKCSCGCDKLSDPIGKNYQRLSETKKWLHKKCKMPAGWTVKKEAFGGKIITKSNDDF